MSDKEIIKHIENESERELVKAYKGLYSSYYDKLKQKFNRGKNKAMLQLLAKVTGEIDRYRVFRSIFDESCARLFQNYYRKKFQGASLGDFLSGICRNVLLERLREEMKHEKQSIILFINEEADPLQLAKAYIIERTNRNRPLKVEVFLSEKEEDFSDAKKQSLIEEKEQKFREELINFKNSLGNDSSNQELVAYVEEQMKKSEEKAVPADTVEEINIVEVIEEHPRKDCRELLIDRCFFRKTYLEIAEKYGIGKNDTYDRASSRIKKRFYRCVEGLEDAINAKLKLPKMDY